MANNDQLLLVDTALLNQAELVCRRRLKTDPQSVADLRSLAEVYRKLGRLGDASAIYDRVFSLAPSCQEAGYLQAVFAGKEWPLTPQGMHAAPFVLQKEVFSREFHDDVLRFVTSVRERFIPILGGNQERYPDSRRALEFLEPWDGQNRFREALMEILSRVMPRLYLAPFEIDRLEVVVRAYQDGHYFNVHRDAPPNSPYTSRMLNFVYYFHQLPRPYMGGDLLLFDSDLDAGTFTRSRFTRVVPEDNSIVIFPCNYYHSVVPIRCQSKEFSDSRFVINGHVHKRPEVETAVDQSIEGLGRGARVCSHGQS